MTKVAMIQPSKQARNIKATMFILSGVIGAVGVVMVIAGDVILKNPDLAFLGKALTFLALVVLMPNRKKDEFYTGL